MPAEVAPDRRGRDPRRSLVLGAAIAACVLAMLAALVIYGLYATFSVRQDKSGLGAVVRSSDAGSHFGLCRVSALDCHHV
jgi:hypothetical protein